MTTSRRLRVALFALPGTALAVVGATHPAHLTYDTSAHWTVMHLVGLLVFPLVGVALVGLVWPRRDPVALAIGVGAYVYAVAYTALDVISGVAAGFVTYRLGPDASRTDAVGGLFEIGGRVGEYGAWAFLLTCATIALDQVLRHRARALLPALLLVGAGISFLDSHIYPWRGVVTVLVIGLSTGWLASLSRDGHLPQNSRVEGSSIPRSAL